MGPFVFIANALSLSLSVFARNTERTRKCESVEMIMRSEKYLLHLLPQHAGCDGGRPEGCLGRSAAPVTAVSERAVQADSGAASFAAVQ